MKALRLLLVVGALVGPAAALAQEPIARSRLLDEQPVLVSAGTRLAVEVLVPTFFQGPVQFPDEIELPDAIVLLAPGSSVNLNERIDGSSWAGVRRTYRVYPTRPGTVRIDEITITVVYALGSGRASEPTAVRTAPVEFDAFIPPEARRLEQFFASDAFTLEVSVTPQQASVRVGDTIERSFTMTARNTPGLFLPALEFADLENVGVYAGQPDLSESGGQRGTDRVAERRESVAYVFEQEGVYELPSVAVNWWDTDAGRLRQETAPALTVTVEPNPELDAAMVETDPEEVVTTPAERAWVAFLRTYWRFFLMGIVLLVVGRSALRPLLQRTRAWLATQRHARQHAESRYFRDFVAVARHGSAPQVHAALTSWLDHWSQSGDTPTLGAFAEQFGSDGLKREIAALSVAAFGKGASEWSRRALVREVDAIRRAHTDETHAAPALAPLNPA